MSEYERLNCKCGYSYITKDLSSKCPNCGKTNWSSKGGIAVILLIVGIAIFLGITFGSIAWVVTAVKTKLSKWHYLGASILGLVMLFTYSSILPYNEYPILNWISYLCNGTGFIYGGYQFWLLRDATTK